MQPFRLFRPLIFISTRRIIILPTPPFPTYRSARELTFDLPSTVSILSDYIHTCVCISMYLHEQFKMRLLEGCPMWEQCACVSMDIRIANTWMAKEGRTAKEAGETTVGWLPLKDFIHPLRPRLRFTLPHPARPRHPYIRVSNLRAIPPFLFYVLPFLAFHAFAFVLA